MQYLDLKNKTKEIKTAKAMQNFGANLAASCLKSIRAKNSTKSFIIYLQGELGVGKTTLVRGFLRGLDFNGKVKSPTFTLVETYELLDLKIFHFDLYRLKDPRELEYIAARDYFATPNSIALIEWPEYGGKLLPNPNIVCSIHYHANQPKTRLISCDFRD
jgi:tRNA threonylcarbamoyladenosine biosynthesis protein TsaE